MAQAARPHTTHFLSDRHPLTLSAWAVVAAFGAYFCTYAFRKPWTAATFADSTVWGVAEKSVLVVAQVLGYMLAKSVGIRVATATEASPRSASADSNTATSL